MNKEEAAQILHAHLEEYRRRSYAELVTIIGETQIAEIHGASGTAYQIEVRVFWDGRPGGDVLVAGSIDDGGWRAFVPLIDSFLLSPDGSFVGE